MRIFDAHVHIYPDKIAEKAATHVGEFYGIPMKFNGKIETLMNSCCEAGVEHCLVHSVATTHEQVSKINDFIKASVDASEGMFTGFCTLHPSMEPKEVDEEIKRVISMGLKGVKLHPDCQKFAIDDKHAMAMYEVIDGRLPILFHTGDKRYDYSNADRMKNAAKRFPKQRMIAAHFGGYSVWEDSVKKLAGLENVWYDESSSLAFITPEKAREYINIYGADRIFFGSDYPMWGAKEELERLERVGLDDSEKEMILWGNITKFLNMEI